MSRVSKDKFIPKIRYLDNLTILFYTTESIYIEDKNNGMILIVHKWFDRGAGRYTRYWKPFREKLKTAPKDFTLTDIIRYARHYELGMCQGCHGFPQPENAIEL